jgi:hypothetical protein
VTGKPCRMLSAAFGGGCRRPLGGRVKRSPNERVEQRGGDSDRRMS